MGLYGGNATTAAEDQDGKQKSRKDYVSDVGTGSNTDDIIAPVLEADIIASPSTQARKIVKEWTQEFIAPKPPNGKSGGGNLNINTASKEELIGLPGVGALIAERIIQSRPYSSLDDLEKVKGLGVKKISAIAPLVSF